MQYWKPSVLSQVFIILFVVRSVLPQDANNRLITHAQTIDDLKHVLGPDFRLFVAAYWRYLVADCNILATRIGDDMVNGRLNKFCNYLTRCPIMYHTQSCLIQISVYATMWACCSETSITPASSTQQPRTPDGTRMVPFDMLDQQTCNYRRVLPLGKIFGGTDSKQGEFPWTVMLLRNGAFLCGGVLMDSRHVITTAHCFDLHTDANRYDVIAGKHSFSLEETDTTEQRVAVTSFVKHEDYVQSNALNDIAVLELARALEYTNFVIPACLPSATDTLEEYCTVTGWGKTEQNEPPGVLMKVELQAYNRTQCLQEFKDTAKDLENFLHTGTICAANGKLGAKDACKGDSGSPLMCAKSTKTSIAWFVFGLVSNGNNCGVPGEPGVYVDIHHYLSWINTTILSLS